MCLTGVTAGRTKTGVKTEIIHYRKRPEALKHKEIDESSCSKKRC